MRAATSSERGGVKREGDVDREKAGRDEGNRAARVRCTTRW